jgi:hypothetical protein
MNTKMRSLLMCLLGAGSLSLASGAAFAQENNTYTVLFKQVQDSQQVVVATTQTAFSVATYGEAASVSFPVTFQGLDPASADTSFPNISVTYQSASEHAVADSPVPRPDGSGFFPVCQGKGAEPPDDPDCKWPGEGGGDSRVESLSGSGFVFLDPVNSVLRFLVVRDTGNWAICDVTLPIDDQEQACIDGDFTSPATVANGPYFVLNDVQYLPVAPTLLLFGPAVLGLLALRRRRAGRIAG